MPNPWIKGEISVQNMQPIKPRNTHQVKICNQKMDQNNPQNNSMCKTKKIPKIVVKTFFLQISTFCGICKKYSNICFILCPIPENTFYGTNTWNMQTSDMSEWYFFSYWNSSLD